MIKIILIIGLIQYIGFYLFGRSNILGCGIVAWAGKTPNKFNKAKFDLVGSYNEERGVHSCGVTTDGKIALGVSKNKVFRDFIVNVGYDNPEIIPTVIGHTRHATFGSHNADNAHPFGFGDLNDGFKFVGVHNGSLLNHKNLATDFKIDLKIDNRDKIDSEVLLEIIYKNKDFKVLSKYQGAAALVFQDITEPNKVYCWHGASKKYATDDNIKIWEERPLYYYKETRNSLYISSMKNSLEAIGGNDETVGEFDHNTLYTIIDGNIEKAEKLKISRKDCHYLKTHSYDYSNNTQNNQNKNKYNGYDRKQQQCKIGQNYNLDGMLAEDDLEYEEWHKHQGAMVHYIASKNSKSYLPEHGNIVKFNIYNEKKPEVNMVSKTYFWKLRYWKQNDLLKGCYIYIENFGFYFLGTSLKTAETNFWNQIVNKEFFAGEFIQSNQKYTSKPTPYVPFVHIGGDNEIINPPLYFFYEGVRVLELLDYISCLENESSGKKFDWESLTHCSAHPIINIDYKQRTVTTQYIKLKDKLFNDTICPLGSNRIYTIKNGNCILISDKKDIEVKEYDTLDSIMDSLEKNENNILKKENEKLNKNKSLEKNNESCDLLDKAIDDVFKLIFQKFPMDIKRLEMYSSKVKAQEAILLLEDFLKEGRKLVELELKE